MWPGLVRGRVEEAQRVLLTLLTTRFGMLPAQVLEFASTTSVGQLNTKACRCFDATDFRDVFV